MAVRESVVSAAECNELDDIAGRFFAAVERGDVEAVRQIYAPDARIWHNFDNYASTREENLGVLRFVSNHVKGFRFEDVRREFLPGAFLQRHVIRGVDEAGNEIVCPAMLRVDCRGGHIVRIEEYFDASQMPELGSE
ncbi:MAG: nuclear transport factor 2 family protein [Acidimicrobiia bacterium]